MGVNGMQIKPLALQRGDDAKDDILVGLGRCSPSMDWQQVCLKRADSNRWVQGSKETNEVVHLQMEDDELATILLPSWGLHCEKMSSLAPEWPEALMESLKPWPLKGRGTIVFDNDFFVKHIVELAVPGQGPVLLPVGAEKLDLPTAFIKNALEKTLSDVSDISLAKLLLRTGNGQSHLHAMHGEDSVLSLGDLLDVSAVARSGYVDLSRCLQTVGPRRHATLNLQECTLFEVAPRMWAHGAAIRNVAPSIVAEKAGCRRGDVIVSANSKTVFDAPLAEVNRVLRASLPHLDIEVEQPVLEGPFYIHAASLTMLQELAGEDVAEAGKSVVPALEALFAQRGGDQIPAFGQRQPGIWAGDGGSTSRLHRDNQHRIEFGHVLHGAKLFAVETDEATAMASKEADPSFQQTEVSFPTDVPLSSAKAEWLCSSGVSVAVGGAGDMLCFWGGDRHFGANAMSSGPCIAFFHG